MIPVRQAVLLFLAVFLSACHVADTDSPARLKQSLEKSGWSEVGAGTAGYSVGLSGIERHVEGIRAERTTPAGTLSLAVGRFSAKIGWLSVLTGGSPESVTISGAGLLLDTSRTQFWWPDLEWPGWPRETAEALNGVFSEGRNNSPVGALFDVVAKVGDSDAPVTAEFRGTLASATAVLQREADRISFAIKRTSLHGSKTVYEITPDIGVPIGPVAVDISRPSIELLGPADLSLVASFSLKDAVLKLGKGSTFTTDAGGFGLSVTDAEAGLLGKLTVKGSVSVQKSSEKTLATIKLGNYPAAFEWTGGKLSRVELIGKESDLKWPAETGKLATLAVGEFFQPYWDGKVVDLGDFKFNRLHMTRADELFNAVNAGLPQISIGNTRGIDFIWPNSLLINGYLMDRLSDKFAILQPLKTAILHLSLVCHSDGMWFDLGFSKINQPLRQFAGPISSILDLMDAKRSKSIFDSNIENFMITTGWKDSQLTREIWANGESFQILQMKSDVGTSTFWIMPDKDFNSRREIGHLKITGPLFSPKIDFADGESRARFLELMSKEFK